MKELWFFLLFPLVGMLEYTPPFTGFAGVGEDSPGGGPSGDAYLQEDGTSYFILEDGLGYLLLE